MRECALFLMKSVSIYCLFILPCISSAGEADARQRLQGARETWQGHIIAGERPPCARTFLGESPRNLMSIATLMSHSLGLVEMAENRIKLSSATHRDRTLVLELTQGSGGVLASVQLHGNSLDEDYSRWEVLSFAIVRAQDEDQKKYLAALADPGGKQVRTVGTDENGYYPELNLRIETAQDLDILNKILDNLEPFRSVYSAQQWQFAPNILSRVSGPGMPNSSVIPVNMSDRLKSFLEKRMNKLVIAQGNNVNMNIEGRLTKRRFFAVEHIDFSFRVSAEKGGLVELFVLQNQNSEFLDLVLSNLEKLPPLVILSQNRKYLAIAGDDLERFFQAIEKLGYVLAPPPPNLLKRYID